MSYLDEDRDNHDDNPPPFPYYFQRESDHSNFNRRILLTAIASLSAVLLLILALHLYARFVLKRQARRRATAIHQLTLTVEANAARYTEESSPGLNPSLIATLPTFLFKNQNENRHVSATECAVCLSVLENEDMLRLLPNCKHSFHVACIDTWLASHSTCPVCRSKVEPKLEPEPRECPIPAPVLEGTSEGGAGSNISGLPKNSNSSRLSSFRRILSRERSSRRIQPSSSCDDGDDNFIRHDLERQ